MTDLRHVEARLDQLWREVSRYPVRWGERTIPPAANNGGNGGNGGCANCFECLPSSQATVGGCSAAPNGAPIQFSLNAGANVFSDVSGTSNFTTFSYGSAVCGSSSSASSGGSGCSWYSCPVSICNDASSSSSSSSASSSTSCGIYQLRLDLSLVSGETVISIYIVFVSGTDWMGTGS